MSHHRGHTGHRGHRGHTGHRGHRGDTGPTGTTEIIILGTNPDTLLIAGENGNPGAPIYIDVGTGRAFLALNDSDQHAQVIGLLGPLGMTAGQLVPSFTADGLLVLPTSAWDAITGDSGGLVPGAAYYVDTTSGRLTRTKPTDDDVFIEQVGIAITGGALVVNVNIGPLSVGPPSPPLGSGFARFSAGLVVETSPTSKFVIPYCPADGICFIHFSGPVTDEFGIGFGSTTGSSGGDDVCWASPISGTLTDLQVNVSDIVNASVDFVIRVSPTCNGPFSIVMTINGVTAPGCYGEPSGTPVAINPGDRISFQANVTKLV